MRNYVEPLLEAAKRNQDRPWRVSGFPFDWFSDIENRHIASRNSVRENLDGNVGKRLLKRARLAPRTAIHYTDDAVPISKLSKRRHRDCWFGCQEIDLGSRFNDYGEPFGEPPRTEGQAHRPFGMALGELGSRANVDEYPVVLRQFLIGRRG